MPTTLFVPISIKKFKTLEDGTQTFILHISSEHLYEEQPVVLREYNRDTLEYTGKTMKRIITYIQDLNDGYSILALGISDKDQPTEIVTLQRKISALQLLLSSQQKTETIYRDLYERDRFDERKLKSLDSEKEMNAVLTEENDQLRKHIKELKLQLKNLKNGK